MYDARTNLSAEVDAEVRKHLGSAVFRTVIPRSVRLSEAPSYGLPIALYRPDSKGAEAYASMAAELRERDGRPEPRPMPAPTRGSATADAAAVDGGSQ
jgi:chromosome partitioning protein